MGNGLDLAFCDASNMFCDAPIGFKMMLANLTKDMAVITIIDRCRVT
jgi:hypothetical protein